LVAASEFCRRIRRLPGVSLCRSQPVIPTSLFWLKNPGPPPAPAPSKSHQTSRSIFRSEYEDSLVSFPLPFLHARPHSEPCRSLESSLDQHALCLPPRPTQPIPTPLGDMAHPDLGVIVPPSGLNVAHRLGESNRVEMGVVTAGDRARNISSVHAQKRYPHHPPARGWVELIGPLKNPASMSNDFENALVDLRLGLVVVVVLVPWSKIPP
jgi:hypothetical protein